MTCPEWEEMPGCCPGGLGLKLAAIFCLKLCSCFASLCTTGLARTLEPFPGSSHENSDKKSFCFILTKPRAHQTIQMVSLSIKQFGPNPGGRRQDQASPDKEVWGLFFSLLLIHIQRNPGLFPGSCCSLRPTPSGCLGDLGSPKCTRG